MKKTATKKAAKKRSIKSPLAIKDVTYVADGDKLPKELAKRVETLMKKSFAHNNGFFIVGIRTSKDKMDGMVVAHNSFKTDIDGFIKAAIHDFELVDPKMVAEIQAKFLDGAKKQKPKKAK